MMRALSFLALLFFTSIASSEQFEEQPQKIKGGKFSDLGEVRAEFVPAKALPGQRVTLKLSVIPNPACYTYPTKGNPGQSAENTITIDGAKEIIFLGPITDPPGAKSKPQDDKKPDGPKDLYYPKKATWEIHGLVSPEATPGLKSIPLKGTVIQLCSATCIRSQPSDLPIPSIEILSGSPEKIPAEFATHVQDVLTGKTPWTITSIPPLEKEKPPTEAAQETVTIKKPALPLGEYEASLSNLRSQLTKPPSTPRVGISGFLLTAALWGLISLVTPCVFPMIPITVSIFLKQSHDSTAQTLKLAGVYCMTIIVVLGVSAFLLLKVFVDLSRDPIMNVALGSLFIVFALSLFGMYDLTLPQGMLRFTQKRQGSGGVMGTIFGAIAFTMIGFTCVAPFLGGFAGLASSGNYSTFELILGSLAFATAFASPFFLLALFPRLLKALPRSGGWLDSVKAVMGFLELAAAFKFFRTAELAWSGTPQYFTYDLSLSAWVAISAACGLYLLNVFRLPHDEEKPNIGVLRMMFSLGFLVLAVYLLPALFKGPNGQPQRPQGVVYAWVDAFLLPDSGDESALELPFGTDLSLALEEARRQKVQQPGKPSLVFVDFTGETCQNCKLNENHVFTIQGIKDQLRQYRRVKLYTDWVPEHSYVNPPSRELRTAEGEANGQFQEDVFGTRQLPYYVILEPLITGGVKVVSTYDEGLINDPAAFAAFLRAPLEGSAK